MRIKLYFLIILYIGAQTLVAQRIDPLYEDIVGKTKAIEDSLFEQDEVKPLLKSPDSAELITELQPGLPQIPPLVPGEYDQARYASVSMGLPREFTAVGGLTDTRTIWHTVRAQLHAFDRDDRNQDYLWRLEALPLYAGGRAALLHEFRYVKTPLDSSRTDYNRVRVSWDKRNNGNGLRYYALTGEASYWDQDGNRTKRYKSLGSLAAEGEWFDNHYDITAKGCLAWLKEQPAGELYAGKPWREFNDLGLWVGYNKEHMVPSVYFTLNKIPLAKRLRLQVYNLPYYSPKTSADEFMEFSYQKLPRRLPIPLNPLNLNTGLEYHYFVTTMLNYRVYGGYSQIVPIHREGELYNLVPREYIYDEMSMGLAYRWENLTLTHKLAYTQAHNWRDGGWGQPWLPLWTGRLGAEYRWNDITGGLDINYYADRRNQDHEDMDDYALLNVWGRWQFNQEWSFTLNLENILDQPYEEYEGLPKGRFCLKAGFSWGVLP